jgi:hypothetical protein
MNEESVVLGTDINDAVLEKILEQRSAKRTSDFSLALEELCRRHRVELVAEPYVTPDGRIGARIRVVGK